MSLDEGGMSRKERIPQGTGVLYSSWNNVSAHESTQLKNLALGDLAYKVQDHRVVIRLDKLGYHAAHRMYRVFHLYLIRVAVDLDFGGRNLLVTLPPFYSDFNKFQQTVSSLI